MFIHPGYHSGGAEIAGKWPPAWAAYLTGYLKDAGYTGVVFIDAMTNHLDDEHVRARMAEADPDIIGATAIAPAISKAERLLRIAKEVKPSVLTVLGVRTHWLSQKMMMAASVMAPKKMVAQRS